MYVLHPWVIYVKKITSTYWDWGSCNHLHERVEEQSDWKRIDTSVMGASQRVSSGNHEIWQNWKKHDWRQMGTFKLELWVMESEIWRGGVYVERTVIWIRASEFYLGVLVLYKVLEFCCHGLTSLKSFDGMHSPVIHKCMFICKSCWRKRRYIKIHLIYLSFKLVTWYCTQDKRLAAQMVAN